jgi:hypothetical protein
VRDRILEALEHVISRYDAEIAAEGKVFGPLETYSCRSVREALKKTWDSLDAEEFDELISIAEFHVGKVILEASKFLTVVRTADLDREILHLEIAAREEMQLKI